MVHVAVQEQEELEKEEEAEEAADAVNPDKQPAPFDPPFAPLRPPLLFWQDGVLTLLMGALMGALGYAYLKAISAATDGWMAADGRGGYPGEPGLLRFGTGRAWWVGLGAATGLAVGLFRAAVKLEKAPTFITELREMHVEPWLGLRSATVTLMSLVGGMPLGPESGLGALSGLLATLLGRLRPFSLHADTRCRLYVLSAMCAAFATVSAPAHAPYAARRVATGGVPCCGLAGPSQAWCVLRTGARSAVGGFANAAWPLSAALSGYAQPLHRHHARH
jgi:hypothetical protein